MSFQFLSVSIIIPCRNEEKYIGRCLDSIIAQDYPKRNLEVFVADGMSDDKTREIVADYCQKYSFIKLLDNPRKFTPFALNIGIKNSSGKIIVRMDAHADYAKDYVSRCIGAMNDSGADNVGGRVMVMPRDNSLVSRAIALCLSSFFGAGNAIYKTKIIKIRLRLIRYFAGATEGKCLTRLVFLTNG
jgi:glycosyltransferase involved in cell wall biosynthesis